MKFGLWEDGKRIEWFNEAQVNQINYHGFDYTQYFKQTDSDRMVEDNAILARPDDFDDRIADMKRKIALINVKISGGSSQTHSP